MLAPGEAARATIREIVELGEHYGLSVAGEIRVGDDPRKTIPGTVRAGNHDLLVMGVSPRPGEELFFGDVARAILADASCSLLFVSAEPPAGTHSAAAAAAPLARPRG